MATVSQAQRLIRISTPLGEDVLVPTAFSGQEQISNPFSYQIEAVSIDDAIAPSDLVGKRVTVSLERLDEEPRFFDGFVNRFTNFGKSHDLTRYHVEVVPWLWFLTRTANCRIFQNKPIPDIIQQVFSDLGMSDFKLDLKGTFNPVEYCVQYRESAFNFVSRLMEREGIFYFFQHEEGKHTMVLANHKQAYAECPEQEVEFQRIDAGDMQLGRIHKWQHDYEFRPGKWAQTDYNFKTPSNSLLTNAQTVVELPGNTKYEIFDFPGDYLDTGGGQNYTDIRMEEDEVPNNLASGTSSCKTFSPGNWFELTGHEIAAENGQYVITSIHHWANNAADASDGGLGGEEYGNSFTCIPKSVVYRPPRTTRRPMVRGAQVAIITGPAGEELYTDEFGRVKVHFPWDRESKQDENSSCWVRVSQIHAGKGFGGIDIPRIGDEVIVAFYEGDPDRPVITGRLYNAQNMPPTALPGAAVLSGIQSQTVKGSGANKLYMDDSKGKENFVMHGQYDMNTTVGNNQNNSVTVDQTNKVGSNQKEEIGIDRETKVGSNDNETVGSNRETSIGANIKTSVGGKEDKSVSGSSTMQIGGLRSETIGGPHSVANPMMNIASARSYTVAAGSKFTGTSPKVNMLSSSQFLASSGGKMDVKASAKLTQQSGAAMDIKSGAALTQQSSAAMNLKSGAAIKQQASGAMNLKSGAAIKAQASGAMNLQSGGALNGKGSEIKLKSPTKIKGTTLTVS
jgi:type VI secretion system secreted protein VgrG